MENGVIIGISANIVTIAVAIGGWIFTWKLRQDTKQQARLEARLERLETEVRARIALERETCDWIAELTGKTPTAVLSLARKKAGAKYQLRPNMFPSDFQGLTEYLDGCARPVSEATP